MGFFKIENHVLILDKEEIRLIPEYRELLVRDKGKSGDDRNSKIRCYKEFAYIYFYADYKSPYIDFPDKQRDIESKKDARLEEDWKPDNAVKLAIDKYIFLQPSSANKILTSLQRGLVLSSLVVDKVCGNIQFILDEIDNDLFTLQGNPETDPIKIKELKKAGVVRQMELTVALVANLTTIQDLGMKIPKTLINIEELAEKVRKEVEGDNLVRGGQKKGNRADPSIK